MPWVNQHLHLLKLGLLEDTYNLGDVKFGFRGPLIYFEEGIFIMSRSNPKNIGIFTMVALYMLVHPGPHHIMALPKYWEMSIKRDKSVGGNRWVDNPHVGRKYVKFSV